MQIIIHLYNIDNYFLQGIINETTIVKQGIINETIVTYKNNRNMNHMHD